MTEKIQNDVAPPSEENKLPWWKTRLFWLNLRGLAGLLWGMLFFGCMTVFVFKMGDYFNDAMETDVRIELMVLFVFIMHIMVDWFWFVGLNEWIVDDNKWFWGLAFLAFVVFAATSLIILVVFLSEAFGFYWQDRGDLWRLLPIGCVVLSIGGLLYKLCKPGSSQKK